MSHPATEDVAARALAGVESTLTDLAAYLAIPAISCDAAHHADVARLAERVAADLSTLGLTAKVLTLPDALPCVVAEWFGRGGDAPTVLVYGHLDLQPVKGEPWDTPPHEAVVRGGRMYARGAADDMGGWVSHLAALRAWFEVAGGPPCNVRLVIEGEEEIGSPNLERYMDAFPDAFVADAMILTDCENPSPDQPGLTVSLRGLFELEVTCEALSADGHSGLWGNMVPDASVALVSVLARLFDADGRLRHGRVDVDAARRASAAAVSPATQTIREGAHLIDGVDPLPVHDRSAAEWMWWQPACTVVSTTLPTPDRKKNALRTAASATLSVRVAPGQSRQELSDTLRAVLSADPPGGVKVRVEERGTPGEGWLYTPRGPAFAAADRAYVRSWGRPLAQVGVGGSIPFVALFGRRFSSLPLLLNGVMDPLTTAHGPNESLHLGLFRKAVLANVHLYDELATLGASGLRA